MTIRFAPPVMYLCDGCGNETVGYMDRLPTSWTVDFHPTAEGKEGSLIAHFCPRPECQAKRPQEAAS